uniref:Uncharacterized protein n=1 Tax=Branchiostoma floridae TaxID=7739 RepID=C3XRX5_BRAFL|eukprot:XP_002613434.1 hypothetical protein BRAFLDRAFT_84558 [Branchiostoma floridae]
MKDLHGQVYHNFLRNSSVAKMKSRSDSTSSVGTFCTKDEVDLSTGERTCCKLTCCLDTKRPYASGTPSAAVPEPVPDPDPVRAPVPDPVSDPVPDPVRAPVPEHVPDPVPDPVRTPVQGVQAANLDGVQGVRAVPGPSPGVQAVPLISQIGRPGRVASGTGSVPDARFRRPGRLSFHRETKFGLSRILTKSESCIRPYFGYVYADTKCGFSRILTKSESCIPRILDTFMQIRNADFPGS